MDEASVPLNVDTEHIDLPKKSGGGWIPIGLAIISGLVVGVLVLIFTRDYYNENKSYNPSIRYKIPQKFEANLVLKNPYVDVKKSMYVQVDTVNHKMRLSYYNGIAVDVFNGNPNTTSFSIKPTYDQIACTKTTYSSGVSLPNFFPALELFELLPEKEVINGVECDAWNYSYIKVVNETYTSHMPDEQGYAGNYTWYMNAELGTPHAFFVDGHNVIDGGSHTDKYEWYYESIVPVKEFHNDIFELPVGMPCVDQPEDDDEDSPILRAQNFLSTVNMIEQHNSQPEISYIMDANMFAHMTPKEKKSYLGRANLENPKTALGSRKGFDACTVIEKSNEPIPDVIDYRKEVELASKYNIQFSGTCFAQAAITSVAAEKIRRTNEVEHLSVMHTTDCSNGYCIDGTDKDNCVKSMGGDGGYDFAVYSWLLNENEGRIASRESYAHPVFGGQFHVNNFCQYRPGHTVNPFTNETFKDGAVIKSCHHVTEQYKHKKEIMTDEELVDNMLDALHTYGPLSVSIDVPPTLYYYKSGVYDDVKCNKLPHLLTHSVVLAGAEKLSDGRVVGYIRNSWSVDWGMEGYATILLKDPKKKLYNICGVASAATFAVLDL